ncbi:hypothetical protein T492DRAFT_230938 [Pavlovales sp. CCMP2436]|nr:hypothetical protein T492DRAFT_230938 [Pavlovales sp. CCMP2436]
MTDGVELRVDVAAAVAAAVAGQSAVNTPTVPGLSAAAAAAAAAEKARSRLSRCGACDNCNRRDCGQCVNCVDKPKFGGPGIKKQACIARKCLNMQAREDEAGAEEQGATARKRPRPPSMPMLPPLSFTTGDEREIDLAADGMGKGMGSHSDENNSESNAAELDTDDAANGELSPKEQKETAWAGNTEVSTRPALIQTRTFSAKRDAPWPANATLA